uniref:MHC class I-like antigen recognition-like domain-containing protein n=1 Tax=Pseudonaja textilis TaxID=8673 RepID=A0A670YZ66_PSETE
MGEAIHHPPVALLLSQFLFLSFSLLLAALHVSTLGTGSSCSSFLSMVHLDDQPIARYDNHTRMLEPLVPWMEMVKMKSCLDPDWIFRADLKSPQNGHPQNEGLHTWQAILGCELGEDGSKGYFHYGYDGMDFISFDKETFRWVTAQPQAQKVKEEWEDHPGWFQENKHFLEETCPVLLKRYLSFGKEALQRTGESIGEETLFIGGHSCSGLILFLGFCRAPSGEGEFKGSLWLLPQGDPDHLDQGWRGLCLRDPP